MCAVLLPSGDNTIVGDIYIQNKKNLDLEKWHDDAVSKDRWPFGVEDIRF